MSFSVASHENGKVAGKVMEGSRDGAVVRALASHRCGPGSNPAPGLSLLLVLVLAPRVFLRVLRFSSLHKNQHAKFQLALNARMPSKRVLEPLGITWINKLQKNER